MKVVTIVIVIILCLVAVQVIVIVAYFAAKRYYYDYIQPRMRFERLKKLAMFKNPGASAKTDRFKRVKFSPTDGQESTRQQRNRRRRQGQQRRPETVQRTETINEPVNGEQDQGTSE